MAENTNVMVVNNNAKLPLVIEENSLFAYFEKIKKFLFFKKKSLQLQENTSIITNADYRF